jgi:predicted exporter
LLLVGLAALSRYRNVRQTIAAVVPSILAAGATVGTLTLLGQELNLLHLLGLLLVCSMGVDYGVFLVDSNRKNEGPAMLSITVGCLSTMFSFGALSLSTAPTLRALGSTIAIGIVLSLILAPIAFLLLSRGEPKGDVA